MRTTLLLGLSIMSLPVITSHAIYIPGITSSQGTQNDDNSDDTLQHLRACYQDANAINNLSPILSLGDSIHNARARYVRNRCTEHLKNLLTPSFLNDEVQPDEAEKTARLELARFGVIADSGDAHFNQELKEITKCYRMTLSINRNIYVGASNPYQKAHKYLNRNCANQVRNWFRKFPELPDSNHNPDEAQKIAFQLVATGGDRNKVYKDRE